MRQFLKTLVFPLLVAWTITSCQQANEGSKSAVTTSADSARSIAKEAWIYGYPMFYNYRSMYLYAMDQNYPDGAGGFNKFKNYGKSFTPADTSVVTPNNDTPYSWAILNLSDEPMILEVPEIDPKRYYVMQLIDLYTFNFAYVGTRSTGNGAGKYLLAGPDWKGNTPDGIDEVLVSETNLVTLLGRIELKAGENIDNVIKIQDKLKISPLHEYLNKPAPAVKSYTQPLPAWKEGDYQSIRFISFLNALLQYTSIDSSEIALRDRFARIGIAPGETFDTANYTKEIRSAIAQGIQDGEMALKASIDKTTSSLDLFGTRADLRNDYLTRATAAAMGLFGNTKEEAVYVGSLSDATGKPLLGQNNYTLRFTKANMPKVSYFWSITMYSLPKRGLVNNPINRYSIGDRSKGLKYEPNGDLVIYLQSTSPGKNKEGNWLPTPASGPYNYVVRLYGPEQQVTNGTWQQPLPELVN